MTTARARKRTHYDELVGTFRALVQRTTPPSATVAVVSKGDHELLLLGNRRAWHFPQRKDGVYAGYYPADSASAIAHLEALRTKGAEYIAFPAAALWWLDEYPEFGRHLERRYQELVRDETHGAVYALADDEEEALAADAEPDTRRRENGHRHGNGSGRAVAEHKRAIAPDGDRRRGPPRQPPTAYVDDEVLDKLRRVFDARYYGEQVGIEFATAENALAHYVEAGPGAPGNPHPLFDARWYLARNPKVRASGENPLAHFVRRGAEDQLDPNPYFDTEHYFSQRPHLREEGQNPLAHYLENAMAKQAPHPNPLFNDSFYLATYRHVPSEAATPLEHFLRFGCDDGRYGSSLHRNIMMQAQRPASSLMRGRWRRGTVLLLTSGERREGRPMVTDLAERLGEEYHLGTLVVSYGSLEEPSGEAPVGPSIVLEDFELAAEIYRPAALRFFARGLAALQPRFAVSDVTEVLEPLSGSGVKTFYMLPEADQLPPRNTLRDACAHASRVLLPSSRAFHATTAAIGEPPTKVSLIPYEEEAEADADEFRLTPTASYADKIVELATTALGPEQAQNKPPQAKRRAKPKIIVPCSDWNVSGVNASLEAVGLELIERGWDLEIVFTRRQEMVFEMVEGDHHLPLLPYRFLDRDKVGVIGMWEALVAELESAAPTILFMAYDFLANSVVPNLSDRVGAVAWAQADDGDYHEQAYRLGLYCNSVVCVSDQIAQRIAGLNPVIGERTRVIHNSSVWKKDIATRRPKRGSKLRLAYSGRLVEYQKRVLDFIDLAEALDRAGTPYELSLIGTFNPREKAEQAFRERAAEHLSDGRIKLLGRLARPAILETLTSHDFFVLLSDFEGLPLSLVEAMARGCVPVVAESPSGIPELVDSGENGLIVSGRDYDEWAELLGSLWQDGRRLAVMSRRARAKVREQFTVEHVGSQFADMFEEIAAEIEAGTYRRPPSLSWGPRRSQTGDVLPPPSMHHPPAFNWV